MRMCSALCTPRPSRTRTHVESAMAKTASRSWVQGLTEQGLRQHTAAGLWLRLKEIPLQKSLSAETPGGFVERRSSRGFCTCRIILHLAHSYFILKTAEPSPVSGSGFKWPAERQMLSSQLGKKRCREASHLSLVLSACKNSKRGFEQLHHETKGLMWNLTPQKEYQVHENELDKRRSESR